VEFKNYKELWQYTFPEHYRDKYQHECGMSGGGGNYPVYDIHIAQDLFILPKCNKLAHSVERIVTPNDWFFLVLNKSTHARSFTNSSQSTFIDPSFCGHLTIEISNPSWRCKKIKKGQPILQILAIPCNFISLPYYGKYDSQPDRPVGPITNRPRT